MNDKRNRPKIARPRVAVAGGGGAYGNTAAALSALDLSAVRGRRVLVKPNVGRMTGPNSGVNCSPDSVAACLDVLREAGAASIAVGESPILGVDVLAAFEACGVAEPVRARGLDLLDLDAAPPIVLPLPTGSLLPELKVCGRVREFDLILSLAVMKTHMHTGVTLGLKNCKGMLYKRQKVALHQIAHGGDPARGVTPLDAAIADMLTVLRPDIAVLDGWVGMEGLGPSAGDARPADIAAASFDPVAADATGCRLMGLDPMDVAHLRLAAEKGLGVADADRIETVPADISPFLRPFRRPPAELALAFPDVAVYESGACSACLSTAMLFLQRFRESIREYRLEDGKLHIALGKDVKDVPEGTIVIGNCAARHKGRGAFAVGCPPVASAIYRAVTGREVDGSTE